jgi:predicted small lipoprotein YifL
MTLTKTLTALALVSALAACGGGGNECMTEANKAAGWTQGKDGRWSSYVIDGCGNRIDTPLPQGMAPSQN